MEAKVDGDLADACELLAEVLIIEPNHLYAGYQLGEIHFSMGEIDDARTVLETTLQRAQKLNDEKAAHELRQLLDMCE